MNLPEDNSIVLVDDNRHLVLDVSNPPVPTRDDIRVLFPDYARDAEGPMVDGVLEMLRASANLSWAISGQYLAGQKSPRYASGFGLDLWGVFKKQPRTPAEQDGLYRGRLLTPINMITPVAIREVVERIVALFSPTDPVILEPTVDGPFALPNNGNGAVYDYWVQPSNRILWGFDSTRPERVGSIYAMPLNTTEFWVIIPQTGSEDADAFALSVNSLFFTDPTDYTTNTVNEWAFVTSDSASLSDTVISEVELRKMAGVKWLLFIEPLLETAIY